MDLNAISEAIDLIEDAILCEEEAPERAKLRHLRSRLTKLERELANPEPMRIVINEAENNGTYVYTTGPADVITVYEPEHPDGDDGWITIVDGGAETMARVCRSTEDSQISDAEFRAWINRANVYARVNHIKKGA